MNCVNNYISITISPTLYANKVSSPTVYRPVNAINDNPLCWKRCETAHSCPWTLHSLVACISINGVHYNCLDPCHYHES